MPRHKTRLFLKKIRENLWYSDRESNSDLLFRRELFYPLNYQSISN